MKSFLCPVCKKEFESCDKRRKFCSRSCSNYFSNKNRIVSDFTKNKISESLKIFKSENVLTKEDREKQSSIVGKSTKGKYNKNPKSILDLSKRTISKIMDRLKIGCSFCGWNEAICDIHHIEGRKIKDADNHENLTYICPNCHRKCHRGLIKKEELINLQKFIGDKWKEFYYG